MCLSVVFTCVYVFQFFLYALPYVCVCVSSVFLCVSYVFVCFTAVVVMCAHGVHILFWAFTSVSIRFICSVFHGLRVCMFL